MRLGSDADGALRARLHALGRSRLNRPDSGFTPF
jgi:hypothetical protein